MDKDVMAFPQGNAMSGGNSGGMSLRDWFAGMALSGMIANPKCAERAYDKPEAEQDAEYARCSYAFADALMSAREAKS